MVSFMNRKATLLLDSIRSLIDDLTRLMFVLELVNLLIQGSARFTLWRVTGLIMVIVFTSRIGQSPFPHTIPTFKKKSQ